MNSVMHYPIPERRRCYLPRLRIPYLEKPVPAMAVRAPHELLVQSKNLTFDVKLKPRSLAVVPPAITQRKFCGLKKILQADYLII